MDLAALSRRLLLSAQRGEMVPWKLRRAMLRRVGVRVAPGVLVVGGVTLLGGRLTLERGAFVNAGVLIDCHAEVTVGEAVHIGPRAMIVTSSHAMGGKAQRAGLPHHDPVTIGAGSWIGAGAIILPGVTVAPGTIVGAGAVVTRDTDPDGIYVGCPAVRVRDVPEAG
jgi:maltose O-acetyltransferase